MINVAVLGARGRMGSEVVKAVEATDVYTRGCAWSENQR
jgi:dihydrodipicolinate reductase